jgi:hypothetical protein
MEMTYSNYIVIKTDDNLPELEDIFIKASEHIIVKEERQYRLIHKKDVEMLDYKYFILAKIGVNNEILKANTIVLFPIEYLKKIEIPNGL